ncbi:hypothetical protein V1517DRAFT_333816 [Lipomyces orientalis]|uniref:Uncharacterized protein n=1 Tax=Lipomyces orientalis TaxID=1233043 RepID=A0ACC3TCZ0_9ASCO
MLAIFFFLSFILSLVCFSFFLCSVVHFVVSAFCFHYLSPDFVYLVINKLAYNSPLIMLVFCHWPYDF